MHEHSSFLEAVFSESFLVVSFVFSAMLLIEFLNHYTLGKWKFIFFKNKLSEYIFCSLLGLLPGCLGGFFVVTLFSHGIVSIGALTAVMIATSGDESFVMLSLIPKHYFYLSVILFFVAIFFASIVDLFVGNKYKNVCQVPSHVESTLFFSFSFDKAKFYFLTFYTLIIVLIAFIIDYNFEGSIILGSSIFGFILLLFIHPHFISEHVLKHIIKKHLLNLSLWTLGSFLIIHIIADRINLSSLIKDNSSMMMVLSGLIGLVPSSGPHLIFTQLFAKSLIPFSVLVCSSISQDGHAGIPLLAESKKSFFIVKFINLIAAFFVGFILLLFNF